MDYMKRYKEWLEGDGFDAATKAELASIAGNEKEIEDRFFTELGFGTGGLRGVMGAGTNRMNGYTVRKATQGLANYILKNTAVGGGGVAIAYDSRRRSAEFAEEAALVLNGNGIRTYLFDGLRPTPELSFAVRELKCTAGIVVTASHNPPEYSGYKVYWSDGGQVPYPRDEEIISEVNKVTDYAAIKTADKSKSEAEGLFNIIGGETDDKFIAAVLAQIINRDVIAKAGLSIVYTPLHGTGNIPVRRALREAGFENVFVVPEQEQPDGDFPTVGYPNPEDPKAFAL
ncbi:MAG: phospho-sugar mutase, partial [Defluviitaleaceae bacterium]|nr:phospho-sugar mutase [Defluviitaleaceae bacterium]